LPVHPELLHFVKAVKIRKNECSAELITAMGEYYILKELEH